MDQQLFLSELATIVEIDALRLDQPLTDGNWDSVAILATIAMVDEHLNISLPSTELSRCTTPQDVWNLVERTKG